MAYLRFPHLHGDTVVFTAEDDVWTAPLDGGRAWRLTADGVPVASPRISPDGARVAWASRRDGVREIYGADVDGGGATRLTWWGDPGTGCAGWTSGGDVLAITGAGEATDRRWAFAVPTGGSPRRLPYGPLTALGLTDGGAVATLSGGGMDAAWWKRYRGGTAGRIWLDRDGSGEFERVLTGLDGQLRTPMLVASGGATRLAFLSDHEGWGNLYSVDLDGNDLRRHTDHGAEGAPAFYARQAATDGERVVYAAAGRLYLVESLDAASVPREIEVRPGGPRSARETFRADVGSDLRSVAPDRTGRTSVVGVRGTVHRLTHRDGPSRTLLAEPGVRARMAEPLGADRAVWIDDADGEDAVCVAPLDPRAGAGGTAARRRRVSAGRIGRVLEMTAAPDGSAVALATHDGRLLVLHLSGSADWPDGTLRELARGGAGEVSDLAWSPDSAWLAFCDPPEPGLSRIVLARVADGELVEVTPARFHDSDPVFTSDGKYLAFLSRRVFDPDYDLHSFDLTFQTGWKPFLVPLAA
ncbi:MAG: peptidase S41, partial [Actinomycetota bacterium]|nr:peptidase S41 [Actinomycetota bacterium]